MDTSFTETLTVDDRERETKTEKERWKSGLFRVLLVLEKRKRENEKSEENSLFLLHSPPWRRD